MRDHTATLIECFASLSAPADFALAPDGQSIAFTQIVGECRQIFVMALDGSNSLRRITATLDNCIEPQWTPDGSKIVYAREHAIWIANNDGTNARELTDHPAGNFTPHFAPDGSQLAFLSRRRGWTQIWTLAPNSAHPTQVTSGAHDVANLVWSPDGKWIAFDSWRAQDLKTRGVFLVSMQDHKEESISPAGYWSGAPRFSPDGRTLAYISDQSGWFHVYLFDLQTRMAYQVTRGEYEDGGSHFYDVDPRGGPVFSPDGKFIAFLRHREGKFDVWIIELATGDTRRVSSLDGYHRIVGWIDSNRLAVTFDNLATHNDLWSISLDGSAKQLIDSSVAELKMHTSKPEWIAYASHDDLKIPAALYRPLETTRAPAVVFIHGGPNAMAGEYFYPLPQILAHEGYVVLSPNYRGSTGYGNAFREANYREWGHADALDVVAGAKWLRAQSFVDPDHIAIVGPSYGGYLTLCALTLAPELFCAGVDLYGDSELFEAHHREDREARMDLHRHMGTPEENPEGYRRGSPVYLAEKLQAPLLLLHGKDDMLVVPFMSEKMIDALKIENKYVESRFYSDEEHGFDQPENKRDAWTRVVDFLNRFCK